ncbi:DUF1758 domain-containing protein [Trichonephila clavipes]|nr:DUF1758 domain-containing protein [Trichonephila clavipes]
MASKAKILKSIQHFDNVGKEIERFEERIRDAIAEPDCSAALIDVLKSKIEKYEKKLEETFSELNIDVGEEKWEKYLDMQDSLLNCSVSLEKVKHTFKKETGKENLENKNLVAKMPKLELPQFHGEMEYWITFKELFQATVIDNSDLTEIDKLQYLFASVKGNAAKLIRGFAIKKENLKNCWELLCERYENKNQLANYQINKLFSIRTNKANSAKQLFEILDNCNESVRNLTVLGLEINLLSELIIINHCTSKLHEEIAHRWELTLKPDTYPTLQAFRMFIESEARALGLLSGNADAPKSKLGTSNQIINKSYARKNVGFEKGSRFSQSNFNQPKKSLVFNANLDKNYSFSCAICKENASHPLYKCPVFNRMKVEERIKAIEGICCTNCLRKNHTTSECRINIGCKVCKDRHHTLLHVYNVNCSALSENSQNVVAVSRGCQLKGNKLTSPVLLSTAIIKIKSKSGKCIECRALIDNASQLSLISGRLKEKLDIRVKSEKHKISGINGVNAETSLHSCTIEFTPHFSSLKFNLEAIVVNKVTSSLPKFQFKNRQFPHLKNLKLADPNFHISKPIDVLLGAEIYADLLEGLPIFGPAGTPTAIPTKLGYILSGKIYAPPLKESIVNSSLNDQLSELWKLEEVPKTNAKIQIPDPCEESVSKSVKRNNEGRYIVNLPFKENNTLGESKEKAAQLLYALENKFHKNKQFKDNFLNFMNEYLALGHMREISQKRDDETPNCYIPYHMVTNEKSTTTKCRVVFNASSKSKNGKSLNDVLMTGPKLQTEIFNHLIKFRSYRVAFAADIERMYRQILISDEDCKYQRIVWRDTPSDSLKSFELQTITYGTSCAPFLALRTLQQLYQDEEQNFPLAAKIARENIYIDDLLSGADTEVEAKSIIIEIQNLLKSGGFILRKWSSSHPKVL